jgi:hypothetical protein
MTKARTLADNYAADINQVTASAPLTGGGTSGTVTVGIQAGTTAQSGAVQLTDSTSSTSVTTAATPNSVKSAYDLANGAIAKSIIAAKGDLLVGTANDTVDILSTGTTGQVLTVDSSTTSGLKWATASAGGMTVIASGSLSGSAVNLTSIPSTYKDLLLVIRNYKTSVDDVAPFIRLQNDSNTRYFLTNYNSANSVGSLFGEDRIAIAATNDNTDAYGLTYMTIKDYTNTSTWKIVDAISMGTNATTTTNLNFRKVFGGYNQTGAISEINIIDGGGGFTGGTYILYGVS